MPTVSVDVDATAGAEAVAGVVAGDAARVVVSTVVDAGRQSCVTAADTAVDMFVFDGRTAPEVTGNGGKADGTHKTPFISMAIGVVGAGRSERRFTRLNMLFLIRFLFFSFRCLLGFSLEYGNSKQDQWEVQ